ncbi:uncharacterized protein LOC127260259 [Andrographis paniculata]|uniref:uncharacterized protein LOC127260259 n=1 Tax=Andrographis paniculata TaxID=175694 RepID=UPI0021E7867F|nr:uncharacterized protein LOC127260259 [Andrographis paniculata]
MSRNDKEAEPTKIPWIEVELSSEIEIVGDPGLRQPIDSYHVNIRDGLRRRYLAKGPCQPRECNFPKSSLGKFMRKFQVAWFDKFDWLEYSVKKDAAFCLVCYLFSKGHKHGGDTTFTEVGFKNWKRALDKFKEHVGDTRSAYHGAKIQASSFRD